MDVSFLRSVLLQNVTAHPGSAGAGANVNRQLLENLKRASTGAPLPTYDTFYELVQGALPAPMREALALCEFVAGLSPETVRAQPALRAQLAPALSSLRLHLVHRPPILFGTQREPGAPPVLAVLLHTLTYAVHLGLLPAPSLEYGVYARGLGEGPPPLPADTMSIITAALNARQHRLQHPPEPSTDGSGPRSDAADMPLSSAGAVTPIAPPPPDATKSKYVPPNQRNQQPTAAPPTATVMPTPAHAKPAVKQPDARPAGLLQAKPATAPAAPAAQQVNVHPSVDLACAPWHYAVGPQTNHSSVVKYCFATISEFWKAFPTMMKVAEHDVHLQLKLTPGGTIAKIADGHLSTLHVECLKFHGPTLLANLLLLLAGNGFRDDVCSGNDAILSVVFAWRAPSTRFRCTLTLRSVPAAVQDRIEETLRRHSVGVSLMRTRNV